MGVVERKEVKGREVKDGVKERTGVWDRVRGHECGIE